MLRICSVFLILCCAPWAGAQRGLWINVPFVRQPRDGCGAATMSMVMEYWAGKEHRPATAASEVEEIQRQLYVPRLHGIRPQAMEGYLRRHGYVAFGFNGKWSDLEQQIAKGRPLIVALRPSGQSELHYVVVVGIDPERGLVMMNDPAERKLLTQERAGFEKDWSATHNWVLLAVPKNAGN